jgi:hypothetical protein
MLMNNSDFEELYNKQFDCVHRYALALTGRHSLAEEITQEAFTRLLNNGSCIKRIERPAAWLMRVARNLAMESFRDQARDRLQPEGMIEFASAENGDKRLAVRFLPTIKTIPPVQDFPALLRSFTLSGLLIRNGDELLSRGTFVSSVIDDLMGGKKPFFTFESRRTGFLIMSYRPFPGAIVAGYFEDKKLIFEWNGDTYECLSMNKPFLPEGRWAAYFRQAAPAFPASDKEISVGGFEADPDELQAKANQMIEMRKGASTKKIGPILQSK